MNRMGRGFELYGNGFGILIRLYMTSGVRAWTLKQISSLNMFSLIFNGASTALGIKPVDDGSYRVGLYLGV